MQGDILKAVEGTVIAQGNKALNTENITFAMVGSFQELVAEHKNVRQIGFGSEKMTSEDDDAVSLKIEDFVSFGMIPELARRITTYTHVKKLTIDEYIRVFKDLERGLLRETEAIFRVDNIKLFISEDIPEIVARKSDELGLGVGGMKTVFQMTLNEKYYEALENKSAEVKIDKGDVEKISKTL